MSSSPNEASRNALLGALPPDVLEALLPKLTPIRLAMRDPIYAADGPVDAVYFPTAGMISMVVNLEDGMQAEVGIVGKEGMAGLSLAAGIDTSFVESMVQLPGAALRMSARDFRLQFQASEPFRTLILRYGESMHAQAVQTAACNGRHGLEQRLARWLLMAHDRVDGDELKLTQEFLAMMLGVHRPSITVTAGILQRAGLISYRPGHIVVLDRAALEAASCECHAAVSRWFKKAIRTSQS